MSTTPLPLAHRLLNRRSALLGTIGLLALPASHLAAAAAPQSSAIWPQSSQVPGGIARLSLGPAAVRPVAHADDVPLLVLGDVIEWTALVGIALSAAPGEARIAVQTPEGGDRRQIAYTVASKRYSEQHLRVSPRTVDLSPENEARYERERAHQAKVMATFSEPLPLRGASPVMVEVLNGAEVFWSAQVVPGRTVTTAAIEVAVDAARTTATDIKRNIKILQLGVRALWHIAVTAVTLYRNLCASVKNSSFNQ